MATSTIDDETENKLKEDFDGLKHKQIRLRGQIETTGKIMTREQEIVELNRMYDLSSPGENEPELPIDINLGDKIQLDLRGNVPIDSLINQQGRKKKRKNW